jgi:mannosyltransferase OCH1-like enzyme
MIKIAAGPNRRLVVAIPWMILVLDAIQRVLHGFIVVSPLDQQNLLDDEAFVMTHLLRGQVFISNTTRRLPSLSQLARQVEPKTCPNNLTYVVNHVLVNQQVNLSEIPKVIHQTSKSRCVSPVFSNRISQWQFQEYSYYLHTDESVNKLLHMHFDEFPLLQDVLGCLDCMTMRADLWRYLILWLYGGIYVDIDSKPGRAFSKEVLFPRDADAVFVVEQYGLLSQYFMASRPRHPIFFYAVQVSLQNIWSASNIYTLRAPMATGPHALHTAFQLFQRQAGYRAAAVYRVGAGEWTDGTSTVAAIGDAKRPDKLVIRNSIPFEEKAKGYAEMGMNYFQHEFERKEKLYKKLQNSSCLTILQSRVKSGRQRTFH